jgi:(+)-abscisic acid 8'-hydroxylase
MPFGNGVHACPGNEIAKLEILILIHHIVTKFRYSFMDRQNPILLPSLVVSWWPVSSLKSEILWAKLIKFFFAGGKWWDHKTGFNMAHFRCPSKDSRPDFGDNVPLSSRCLLSFTEFSTLLTQPSSFYMGSLSLNY